MVNGVVETDKWLETLFFEPAKICEKFCKDFNEVDADKILKYLQNFGMYSPNQRTLNQWKRLKEQDCWNMVDTIYRKYKKEWNGPDVPIYIFPIRSNCLSTTSKSGISFKHQMFLFISSDLEVKEWEALFIHEYHHVCRLNGLGKMEEELTLLDSIILEGMAEHAVQEYCGEDYTIPWVKNYSDITLEKFWDYEMKSKLHIKKLNILHDQILFGRGYPKMIGYAIGYYLIGKYKTFRHYSTRAMIYEPSTTFLLY